MFQIIWGVGAWLVRYRQLLQRLRSFYLKASACSVIVAGMQQAAAGPSGLHLQEVDICLHSSVAGTFVQQLPSQHMWRLVLDIHGREYSDDEPVVQSLLWSNPCYAQTCSALAGLTGLQSLKLLCSDDDDNDIDNEQGIKIDPYIPGIASLPQLTRLHLGPCSPPLLAKLPAQLQTLELDVSYVTDQPEPLFQLGHLTAMSCLCLIIDDDFWDNECGYYVFKPGDVLPSNLRHLSLFAVSDAEPISRLSRLEHLDAQPVYVQPGMFLEGLSHLTKLHDIRLYCGRSFDKTDVPYWHAQAAMMDSVIVPGRAWPLASALQSLSLCDLDPWYHAETFSTLPAAIMQLTGLQIVHISADNVTRDRQRIDRSEVMVQLLAKAVATLPQLHELEMASFQVLDDTAAADLASLTSLTRLMLSRMGLTDTVLIATSPHNMMQLKVLDVRGNSQLTEESLHPLVAQSTLQVLRRWRTQTV